MASPRGIAPALAFALASAACERGCARPIVESRRAAVHDLGLADVVDCPDGLARCEANVVSVSRLATVPRSCSAPPPACSCPWDPVGPCPDGCVADGVEIVVERAMARAQLCAPGADAGVLADAVTAAMPPQTARCEEGEAYRCGEALVAECPSGRALGHCRRGCSVEGASIVGDGIGREAAFAILCSR